jgi:hypothetical protein
MQEKGGKKWTHMKGVFMGGWRRMEKVFHMTIHLCGNRLMITNWRGRKSPILSALLTDLMLQAVQELSNCFVKTVPKIRKKY